MTRTRAAGVAFLYRAGNPQEGFENDAMKWPRRPGAGSGGSMEAAHGLECLTYDTELTGLPGHGQFQSV